MKALSFCVLLCTTACCSFAGLVTYPAPGGEPLSTNYTVEVSGKIVPVYTARVLDAPFDTGKYNYGGPYSFTGFDLSGPAQVRIRSTRKLNNLVIRPARKDVKVRTVDSQTVILSVPGPCKLSVEPDGRNSPLLLFASSIEKAPDTGPDDPNLLYFPPGIHHPGKIALTNDQTLYISGGALVKGGVVAEGKNIRIRGRGILDGSDYEWRKGPTPDTISIRGTNIEVSGITIRGSSHWTIVPRNSSMISIRDVKICGSRVQNDDGINPCNSQDVHITDCFIRSDDDCIALKGLDLKAANNNVERITVENCILWCDRARVFLLGHESRAALMQDIQLRSLDIIHFSMTAFLFEPGEEMRLQRVEVENVRLNADGQNELIRLKPVVNQYMHNKVPGHIADIHFKNVTVGGGPGACKIQVMGADPTHQSRKVIFSGIRIGGNTLTQESPSIEIGPHVVDVRVLE